MDAIGGYFSLELNVQSEYHENAIKLNTGRNAFEYILKANNYKKIYLPFFTCDVILQPIIKLNIEYEFYSITQNFEPIFDFSKIVNNHAFLYTNYFGLKDSYIKTLGETCKNLIIDNAQSFYSKRINNIDTFYSCRKFFGVPDGAYLYSNKKINDNLEKDISYNRFEHLLKRIDTNAEEAYIDFVKNDNVLNNMPILQMSELTQKLMQSINYKEIALIRKKNFTYLHDILKSVNLLKLTDEENHIPMVYPFLTDNLELRNKLIQNKIYTAQYWPNVLKWTNENSIEYKFTTQLINLPIDQRLEKKELDKILKNILQ